MVGIVCVAGGQGKRFGGDKLAAHLGSRTVLDYSTSALRLAYPSAPISVVVPANRLRYWTDRLEPQWDGVCCVEGGKRRQDSVRRGVEAIANMGVGTVAVHDGARPLVHRDDIRAVVEGIGTADGCILGQAASDTVKRVDARGVVVETIERRTVVLAQTPQVFRLESLQRAWNSANFAQEWTDEAALLESLGMKVTTVIARHPNPKLTNPSDLVVLRALEASRQ